MLDRLGFLGSIAALLTAACCVLPVALMLVGAGGAWLAVFGVVAAAGFHVAAVSAVLLAVAWTAAVRRRAGTPVYRLLGAGTAMTAAAWIVMLNEEPITDFLLTLK